ncbi:50S ribosomal protein L29 [Candidatus Methanosphaera massiliense]|jgi:large subunit ribosomal protein L29|uniref:50S ribosomal protein L29 n=1 Tax=Methanosphaera TaxID=2316 RepID=UPI000DC3BD23|nr:50S ribosomal protein L29 [Candidatus Methanosphaera massiliense]MDD6285194.1 50S ribosomal protein L29 [Methanobacteriaceae archaeon]MDE4078467.1 50S ribosomal protein L29 [Candidatus Methanosphaera massiliense]RAP45539.1 MAG: 50S ribosomal protein L29 [Methanosphaera sp. SHI1033]
MVILRSRELRELSASDLEAKLNELHAEYDTLVSKGSVAGVDNPGKIRETRRTIARVLTIMNENKQQGE